MALSISPCIWCTFSGDFVPFFLKEAITVLHVKIVLDPIVKRLFEELLKMEFSPIVLTNIVILSTCFEVRNQMLKLLVIRVFLERSDGDAIFELLPERIHSIVNEEDVLEFDIFEHSQVLDVFATLCFDAAITIESMLDELTCWIEVVDDTISVLWCTSSEYTYLVKLVR